MGELLMGSWKRAHQQSRKRQVFPTRRQRVLHRIPNSVVFAIACYEITSLQRLNLRSCRSTGEAGEGIEAAMYVVSIRT